MESSLAIWRYVVNVKSMVKILSIFVASLENMNFTQIVQKIKAQVCNFWIFRKIV